MNRVVPKTKNLTTVMKTGLYFFFKKVYINLEHIKTQSLNVRIKGV